MSLSTASFRDLLTEYPMASASVVPNWGLTRLLNNIYIYIYWYDSFQNLDITSLGWSRPGTRRPQQVAVDLLASSLSDGWPGADERATQAIACLTRRERERERVVRGWDMLQDL